MLLIEEEYNVDVDYYDVDDDDYSWGDIVAVEESNKIFKALYKKARKFLNKEQKSILDNELNKLVENIKFENVYYEKVFFDLHFKKLKLRGRYGIR